MIITMTEKRLIYTGKASRQVGIFAMLRKALRCILLLSAVLILPSLVQGAPLVSVTDTPSNFVVSTAGTTHTISFVTVSSDTVARVTMGFKPGFTLSGVTLGTVTGLSTGTISVTGDTVIYSITNPNTVSATTACTIPLGNITNASICTTTYAVIVSTRTSADTIIDGPTQSNTFALLGNSFKITTTPQVLQAGETSSAIKVIACDVYGNTDVLFNDTVLLSGSSSSRQFSSNGSSWISASDTAILLTIGTGQFYYKDTSTGLVYVSVSRSGYTSYVQSVKIVGFLGSAIPPDTSVTVVISSAATTVTIPSGTFGSTICIAITDTPSSSAITNANNSTTTDQSLKLVSELGGTVREIAAFAVVCGVVDYSQPLDPQTGKSITITIPYSDVPAASGSLEDGLRICRLDESTEGWIILSDPQTINKSAKTVSKTISSFSVYRLISLGAAQNLSNVIVYPNPYEFARARDGTLKFINLPTQATIKIYNIAGELVRTIPKDDAVNRATWDGKNEFGEKVATGIYVYVISSPQDTQKRIGKIAVIASE
ncbi:hypothetical protein COY52_05380 [Candidatus Desantisbacteria bacterium CG_4_10_14_0_8_um_filter_48_22]|uniref:FlgD/Vpr Ig-like domain-containing protein n=2 Tax=unclassified Candidatus Desantisiibacteriota TaxID=3106372 RepID=A0A2M7SC42_9BACT|nr:MAG: hypothetical protein COS91_05290 [Candidatus Desantisbacteria bacterium CG07_land_8_20_14_0_80_39_15]PIZ17044.1 MAG: hypothetical protein COY52_05380 [Candidatus Desantisbacteria bacterium CG_4_10_14_0_8_um_filter_48_22]